MTLSTMTPSFGFAVSIEDLVLEGWQDATRGSCKWRTLVGGIPGTTGLSAGLAEFGPFETLNAHRHTPPEVYFCTAGGGTVTIDGAVTELRPGMAVYIPSDAEHCVVAGPEGLTFFYTFPCDQFADVDYRFSASNVA